MRIDGWTLLLQAINFLVLAWLLRHFLYRPVLAVIAERQATTERARVEADAARADAGRLRQGLEGERAGLSEERDRLLADARRQADAERAALLDRARADAARLLAEAAATLDDERRQAVSGQREAAAELALAVAARLLGAADSAASLTQRFLNEACQSVAGLAEADRRALVEDGASPPGIDTLAPLPLRLVSAAPLDEGALNDARTRLETALGRPVALDADADPGLIAGVELHFPHSVLRHSWKQALAEAMEELTRDDRTQNDAHKQNDAGKTAAA